MECLEAVLSPVPSPPPLCFFPSARPIVQSLPQQFWGMSISITSEQCWWYKWELFTVTWTRVTVGTNGWPHTALWKRCVMEGANSWLQGSPMSSSTSIHAKRTQVFAHCHMQSKESTERVTSDKKPSLMLFHTQIKEQYRLKLRQTPILSPRPTDSSMPRFCSCIYSLILERICRRQNSQVIGPTADRSTPLLSMKHQHDVPVTEERLTDIRTSKMTGPEKDLPKESGSVQSGKLENIPINKM